MRSFVRRWLRLEFVSALGLALVPATAVFAQAISTQTTLSVSSLASGASQAVVTVTGADGQPGTGVINIEDSGRILAQTQLSATGQASIPLTLTSGDNSLTAVYLGDSAHQASTSVAHDVAQPQVTGGTPSYQVGVSAVSPSTLPMTLTPGQSGSVTVTLTPVNNASLTAPMFVTLSCSGLPSLASCSFTPTSLEIQSTTPTSCAAGSPASACPPTSLMSITTSAVQNETPTASTAQHKNNAVAWALLLPGVLGLGGIGFAARRRRWLQRLVLVALVGIVTTLGMTGCNPQYDYFNHGPGQPPATPAGTYTVTVTAQSTNGVTATTNSTTLVLTVE